MDSRVLVGGIGPDEREKIFVPRVDPGADVGVEARRERCAPRRRFLVVSSANQCYVGSARARGGREVQDEARLGGGPMLDGRRLVRSNCFRAPDATRGRRASARTLSRTGYHGAGLVGSLSLQSERLGLGPGSVEGL